MTLLIALLAAILVTLVWYHPFYIPSSAERRRHNSQRYPRGLVDGQEHPRF